MIVGKSIQTDVANIEHMDIIGNVVSVDGSTITCVLMRDELTTEEQSTYDEAIALVGANYYNKIENTQADLTINRVTSSVLVEGEDILDFNTLSQADKDKLNAFLAMVISKKN